MNHWTRLTEISRGVVWMVLGVASYGPAQVVLAQW